MGSHWTDNFLEWLGLGISLLALLAGILALYGLSVRSLLTRPRRLLTRRCPGRFRLLPFPWRSDCWYDLTGVPRAIDSLTTCPECGLRSPESALHRPRRRWRRALVCLIPIQFLAYTITAAPRMRHEGWTGLVPTTALVLLVPHMTFVAPSVVDPPLRSMTPAQRLFHAFDRRSVAGELTRWQWRIALDGFGPALDKTDPSTSVFAQSTAYRAAFRGHLTAARHRNLYWSGLNFGMRVRPVWPEGATVYAQCAAWRSRSPGTVRARIHAADGAVHDVPIGIDSPFLAQTVGRWRDVATIPLGAASALARDPNVRIRFEYPEGFYPGGDRWLLAREWIEPVAIRTVPRVEDILNCAETPEITQALASGLRPLLVRYRDNQQQLRHELVLAPGVALGLPRDTTIALQIEILRNNVVVARAQTWDALTAGVFDAPPIVVEPLHPDIDSSQPAQWQARVIGDPLLALREPNATAAWVGRLTVDLQVPPVAP